MVKRPRLLQFLLAAACLATCVSQAMASAVRALDLADLTAGADQVVVADVLTVTSAWDRTHRTITTTIEIAVRESWKGSPSADGRITIRQPGGTVGEIEMTVHGMSRFVVGERALLFLHRSQIVGMAQGKRTLRWEAAKKQWLVEAADRTGAVNYRPRGSLQPALPGQTESLEALRETIRDLARK
jgi:hypothetical protein